jgi:hypothetical protein
MCAAAIYAEAVREAVFLFDESVTRRETNLKEVSVAILL